MLYRDGKKVEDESADSDEEDSNSGLIAKSLLPEGAKVGDTVMFKISHLFDDEAEVKYSHSDKAKDDNVSKEPKSDEMEAAESELDAMAAPAEA